MDPLRPSNPDQQVGLESPPYAADRAVVWAREASIPPETEDRGGDEASSLLTFLAVLSASLGALCLLTPLGLSLDRELRDSAWLTFPIAGVLAFLGCLAHGGPKASRSAGGFSLVILLAVGLPTLFATDGGGSAESGKTLMRLVSSFQGSESLSSFDDWAKRSDSLDVLAHQWGPLGSLLLEGRSVQGLSMGVVGLMGCLILSSLIFGLASTLGELVKRSGDWQAWLLGGIPPPEPHVRPPG
jgi:hypothetical protein